MDKGATSTTDGPLGSRLETLQSILRDILRASKLELEFSIRPVAPGDREPNGPEIAVELSGPDVDVLLEKKGAVLDALEHVALKAARVDEDSFGKIVFDANGFRRLRTDELRAMARIAADRVIEVGDPFEMNPMTPRERRIVHLALRDETRVRTESEGRGPDRRIVIRPASLPR